MRTDITSGGSQTKMSTDGNKIDLRFKLHVGY